MRGLRGFLLSGRTSPVTHVLDSTPVPFSTGSSRNGAVFNLPGQISSDMVRQMEVYGSNGIVFPVVDRLAVSTASAEWKLWRKARSGKAEDRQEVTAHAALDLLNRPNRFMDRHGFMESVQQHMDLTGEGDILLGRIGNTILDMWPCRPDRLSPVPDPKEFLLGWTYTGPNNEKVPIELTELLQMKMPNPLDPYRGMGPIQSILADLDAARYGAEWQASFFRNSAEPGGIIQVDRMLDDDDFDQLRQRWAEQHQGVSKAHRVAIIEGGMTWVDRKITQKDMQFAELRTIGRDVVLAAFGFPKSVLGIVEDVNRASAEASEYLFSKWLVSTRLDRWKAMLNYQLLPMYPGGDKLEFDYVSPVPENSDQENMALTARAGAVAQLVPLGFDPAEVLAAVGLPEILFVKPEPVVPVAAAPPPAAATAADPALANRLREIDAAMKWEAVEHVDASTCEKCKANDGKLYRNREDAYKDYPDGKGFKDCVGAEFGNDCRGHVRKRKAD